MKGKREADNNFNFKSEKLDELRSRVDAAFDEHGDEAWEQIKGIFTHPKRLLVAALAAVRGGEDAAVRRRFRDGAYPPVRRTSDGRNRGGCLLFRYAARRRGFCRWVSGDLP